MTEHTLTKRIRDRLHRLEKELRKIQVPTPNPLETLNVTRQEALHMVEFRNQLRNIQSMTEPQRVMWAELYQDTVQVFREFRNFQFLGKIRLSSLLFSSHPLSFHSQVSLERWRLGVGSTRTSLKR